MIGQDLSSQENIPLQRRGRERVTWPQPHLHPSFYHPWDRRQYSLGEAFLKDLKSKFTLLREWRKRRRNNFLLFFLLIPHLSPPFLLLSLSALCCPSLSLPSPPSCSLYLHFQLPSLSDYILIPSSSWGSCLVTCSVRHVFDSKSHVSQIWLFVPQAE